MSVGAAKMAVGEVEVLFPIIVRDAVRAVEGEQGVRQGVGEEIGLVVVAAVGGGLGGVGEEGENQGEERGQDA